MPAEVTENQERLQRTERASIMLKKVTEYQQQRLQYTDRGYSMPKGRNKIVQREVIEY